MPDDDDARVRRIVDEKFRDIGILLADDGLRKTRRNFVWLEKHASEDERREQQADDQRRERSAERYKTVLALMASVCSYIVAGTLGASVTWFLSQIRGHH